MTAAGGWPAPPSGPPRRRRAPPGPPRSATPSCWPGQKRSTAIGPISAPMTVSIVSGTTTRHTLLIHGPSGAPRARSPRPVLSQSDSLIPSHGVDAAASPWRKVPAPAQRLVQGHDRLQPCDPHLRQRVQALEQARLRVQHGDDVDRAFPQALLGDLVGLARALDGL